MAPDCRNRQRLTTNADGHLCDLTAEQQANKLLRKHGFTYYGEDIRDIDISQKHFERSIVFVPFNG